MGKVLKRDLSIDNHMDLMKSRRRDAKRHVDRRPKQNLFRRTAVLLGFLASACSSKPAEKPAEKPKPAKVRPSAKISAAQGRRIKFEMVEPGSSSLFKKLLDTIVVIQPSKSSETLLKVSALAFDSNRSDATNVRFKVYVVKKGRFSMEHLSPDAKSGKWAMVPGCENIIADRMSHPDSVRYSYYFAKCDVSNIAKAEKVVIRATFLPEAKDKLKQSSAIYELYPER